VEGNRAGELLGQLLKRYKLESGLRRGRALAIWPEVAGEMLARLTSPVKLERGELLVRVENATLAHQLTYQREELLRRYAARLGAGVVKEIRFIGGKTARPPAPDDDETPKTKASLALPLELAQRLQKWKNSVPAELAPAVERAGRALLADNMRQGGEVCPICERRSDKAPCEYCLPLTQIPLVRRAARRLEQDPRATPLEGDLLAAARWLTSERLQRQIAELSEQVVREPRLMTLLEDRVRRYCYLPLRGETPEERLMRLPETTRSLVKNV